MDQLVAALFLWLASNGITPLNPYDVHPKVTIVSQEQINKQPGARMNSAGLCKNGEVILSKNVDLTTEIGKSILLHELVHYTQNHCPILKPGDALFFVNEKIAYDVQNKYLAEKRTGSRAQNPYEQYRDE